MNFVKFFVFIFVVSAFYKLIYKLKVSTPFYKKRNTTYTYRVNLLYTYFTITLHDKDSI